MKVPVEHSYSHHKFLHRRQQTFWEPVFYLAQIWRKYIIDPLGHCLVVAKNLSGKEEVKQMLAISIFSATTSCAL